MASDRVDVSDASVGPPVIAPKPQVLAPLGLELAKAPPKPNPDPVLPKPPLPAPRGFVAPNAGAFAAGALKPKDRAETAPKPPAPNIPPEIAPKPPVLVPKLPAGCVACAAVAPNANAEFAGSAGAEAAPKAKPDPEAAPDAGAPKPPKPPALAPKVIAPKPPEPAPLGLELTKPPPKPNPDPVLPKHPPPEAAAPRVASRAAPTAKEGPLVADSPKVSAAAFTAAVAMPGEELAPASVPPGSGPTGSSCEPCSRSAGASVTACPALSAAAPPAPVCFTIATCPTTTHTQTNENHLLGGGEGGGGQRNARPWAPLPDVCGGRDLTLSRAARQGGAGLC